jgi:hypothetical protein
MPDIHLLPPRDQDIEDTAADTGNERKKDYRSKIRSHRFTLFYKAALVILMAAGIVLIVWIQWKNKLYSVCAITSSVKTDAFQDNSLVDFDGDVLSYGKDGACCVSPKGKTLWNITYEMQDPMVRTNGSMAAIGDFDGQKIYVMDKNGTAGEISTTMPIYKFCIAQNGVVAAVLNDTSVTWIYVYDSSGNKLAYFKTTMRQSGYPVDVAISPNGILVGVSYLHADAGALKTSIAFYNFGGVGQNETDNYVSGYDYSDTLAPDIDFLDSKTAYAAMAGRLVFYTGGQKPVSAAEHIENSEIQSVYSGDGYVVMVFNSSTGDNRYRMDIYNKAGNLLRSKDFNIDYTDIKIKGDLVYVYNETECLIYNVNGIVKFSGNLGRSAKLIIPSGDVRKMQLVTDSSIDEAELK